MATQSYYSEVLALAKQVKKKNKKIDLFLKRKRPKTPTQAFSEFLTNREQGDWAEDFLFKIINSFFSDLISVKYGRTDNIVAGEVGFEKFYKSYQDELSSLGKCPDLLVYDKKGFDKRWIQELAENENKVKVVPIVKKAIAGLEVRSSAFLVQEYEVYIKKEGKKGKRKFLSFTPKVEDLAVILKWIEKHDVPHFYVQVFFDGIYIIPFKRILEIIVTPEKQNTNYVIEKNAKNQFKSTIHINLNQGVCVARAFNLPKHESSMRKLPRGRLMFYVKFMVNELPKKFDSKTFWEIIHQG